MNVLKSALLGSVCTLALQANLVVPNGPWQTVVTPTTVTGEVITSSTTTNPGGNAYWNNKTLDGNNCQNIGCYMTSSGGFSSSGAGLANPVYLGNNDGSYVSDFYFQGAVQNPVTLLLEVAGFANRNWFGWYDVNTFDAANASTWGTIFDGAASAGATVSVTIPTDQFGFWFVPNLTSGTVENRLASGDAHFTQSSKNKGGFAGQGQYFALFAESVLSAGTPPATFWLGIEDVVSSVEEGRGDFNDMIVKITIVPEPGFYGALALGMAGLYLGLLRRKA